jgi:hypothetical protein
MEYVAGKGTRLCPQIFDISNGIAMADALHFRIECVGLHCGRAVLVLPITTVTMDVRRDDIS